MITKLKIALWVGFGVFMVTGVVNISQSGMMNLHGKAIVGDDLQTVREARVIAARGDDNARGAELGRIAPAAGSSQQSADISACGGDKTWIGQPLRDDALEQFVRETGNRFRVLPPFSMMTMEHNPGRLNVHTDDDGVVVKLNCG